MRSKILTGLMLTVLFTWLYAGDLFFSEYIEGSSNNKAIEIYNPTGSIVDLSQYTIKQSNNGYGWGSYSGGVDTRYSLPLSGTLAPGDVYVVYNSAATNADFLRVGDLGLAYNGTANGCVGCNVPSFNGDDALGLFKGEVLIDVIGIPTVDPGTGWAVAGTANGTYDHTLVRKPTVLTGNTNWESSAGTNADNSEWIVYPKDTLTYLGAHVVVSGKNVPPIAKAGSDQTVWLNSEVTLDGSGSTDPDGHIVSYAWSQLSGPTVTLVNPNQAIASFSAPSQETNLSFVLTVVDDSSATGKDTVNIAVIAFKNVFISEYVEGTSNNKYIELYNADDSPVDLAAAGFEVKTAFNGSNSYTASFSSWGGATIPAKGIVVLANASATLYTGDKIVVPSSNYTMNFNGNDAVGLFLKGTLVDIIGYPNRIDTILNNRTMRRRGDVLRGNLTYTPSEWIEYGVDDISGLGTHSANPYAPTITNVTISPDFIQSNNEITITADVVPVVGNIASVKVFYGTNGVLVNQSDLWLETGNQWVGTIPPQSGNYALEYKIVATDDSGNSGESPIQHALIADTQPLDISTIHANISQYDGKIVTIRGIVTIGAGVLRTDRTSAYIQDNSGRGLNLYDLTLYSDIQRGDELVVVGYVDLYYTTVEVTDFKYKKLSQGNALPAAQTVTVAEASSSNWEGTLIQLNGVVVANVASGTTAQNISVVMGTDTIIIRIPNSTGIAVNSILVGNSYWFKGVGTKYSTTFQVLVGYAVDIWPATAIKEKPPVTAVFELKPLYPNPFNATASIHWQLDRDGFYELAVYNLLGQKVAVVSQGFATAGKYHKLWDAGDLPTGIYFLQLISQQRRQTQKIILMK